MGKLCSEHTAAARRRLARQSSKQKTAATASVARSSSDPPAPTNSSTPTPPAAARLLFSPACSAAVQLEHQAHGVRARAARAPQHQAEDGGHCQRAAAAMHPKPLAARPLPPLGPPDCWHAKESCSRSRLPHQSHACGSSAVGRGTLCRSRIRVFNPHASKHVKTGFQASMTQHERVKSLAGFLCMIILTT